MQLRGNRFQPTSDPPHLTVRKTAAYVAVILLGLSFIKLMDLNYIRSPFAPPATPTRSATSWVEEGKSFFDSGKLEKSILAYQNAVGVDSKNAQLWAELARIQAYSSALLPAPPAPALLQQALASVEKSIAVDSEYAQAYAVKTLVLDWTASLTSTDDATRQKDLDDAYTASAAALTRDPNNPYALAFRAEVLADQGNWSTAMDYGALAVTRDPKIMDVHRAYGYVLESNAYYTRAIDEYKLAIEINPNLEFLHLRLGANYRKLGETATSVVDSQNMIDSALNEFSIAAGLNPEDWLPYMSIAQTQANQGNFFDAERNARKALDLKKTDPVIYGRLGVIYYHAKNYENSIKVLTCAIRGCLAADNEEQSIDIPAGAPLNASTIDIYYTYGSVKAFYGDEPGNCTEARRIFSLLRASPWYDTTVEAIIREGELICAKFERPTTPVP